jgi:predicted Zn-dependent peptidase
MNYKQTTLKNGLRLITTCMPNVCSASVAFFFATGSRYEQQEVLGISHFIEHMLFKGSKSYPSAKLISEAIEGVGGSFNGCTCKEMTSYTARVPSEYVSVVMKVLADMVRYPLFDPADIEKERAVIIEELSATQDDPQEWVGLLIDETMWPGLPLGRDDAGSIDSVMQLQRQQMLDYLDAYYRPNSLVVSIAGNIDQQQIIHLTEELFHDWQAGPVQSCVESFPIRDVAAVRMVKKDTEQANICLATLGVSYISADYYPFLIINSLLGDGMSSRLFQSIREEQGLAYDIGTYLNSYYETGSLVVSAGVDPAHTKEAVSAIVSELTRLCNEPVPNDELERIKAYVRGGILLGLEGTQQMASWLGSQECLYHCIRDVDEVIANVNAVSTQDIQRVAQVCFAPEWRRLAIIGPEDVRKAESFKKLLVGA